MSPAWTSFVWMRMAGTCDTNSGGCPWLARRRVRGPKRSELQQLSDARAFAFRFVVGRSKARCTSLNGFLWLPDCNAKGSKVVGVNDHKLFGISAALEIERFVFGAVDVNDLTRFQANPNPCH